MTDQQALTLRRKMLGAMLRDARLNTGRSLQKTAELIGISSSTLASYERGRAAISLPELELLAYHLDIPLNRLLERSPSAFGMDSDADAARMRALRDRVIGAQLRAHRQEAGMSMRELGEKVGFPASRISAYEAAKRAIPLTDLETLAEALGRSVEDYLDDTGPLAEKEAYRKLAKTIKELPPDLRKFLGAAGNEPYIRLAIKLSQLPSTELKGIAESLLKISL